MIHLTPSEYFLLGMLTGQIIGFVCSVVAIKIAQWKLAKLST